MTISFTKVSLPYGWLGNMSPHPVVHEGIEYPTSEHLFQLLRYDPSHVVWTEIPKIKSPMGAKMAMKKYHGENIVEPLSEKDFENMSYCLALKLERNPELVDLLKESGEERLVEDVTKRQHGNNMVWGCALIDDEWVGVNVLGDLWEEIRTAIK